MDRPSTASSTTDLARALLLAQGPSVFFLGLLLLATARSIASFLGIGNPLIVAVTGAAFVLFGGGIKKGTLYGKTADERPCTTIENPVPVENLHATIYRAMGISPKLAYEVEQRPFYVTEDGKGKPVDAVFA